jgi:hypothetical protein
MQKTITSNLDKARSKIAIEKAMEDYKARFAEYSPRYDWTSDDGGEFSFNAKGIKLGGTIRVRDNFVDVDMDVPFLFRIFQSKAMDVIQEQVELWVERVRSGKV